MYIFSHGVYCMNINVVHCLFASYCPWAIMLFCHITVQHPQPCCFPCVTFEACVPPEPPQRQLWRWHASTRPRRTCLELTGRYLHKWCQCWGCSAAASANEFTPSPLTGNAPRAPEARCVCEFLVYKSSVDGHFPVGSFSGLELTG